jgi:hypothetical protein
MPSHRSYLVPFPVDDGEPLTLALHLIPEGSHVWLTWTAVSPAGDLMHRAAKRPTDTEKLKASPLEETIVSYLLAGRLVDPPFVVALLLGLGERSPDARRGLEDALGDAARMRGEP